MPSGTGFGGDVDGLGMALRLEVCKEDGVTPDRDLTDRIFAEGLKGDLEITGRKYGLVLDSEPSRDQSRVRQG